MVNKILSFQLWRASTGKIYHLRPSAVQRFQVNAMRGISPSEPVRLTTTSGLTQQISLDKGWNWTSWYLQPANDSPNALLTAEQGFRSGDLVKSPSGRQFAEFVLSDTAAAWYGTLSAMNYRQMYMISTSQPLNLSIAGKALSDDERTVTIYGGGWSSIAYLLDEPQNVRDALGDYFSRASVGDVIKSKTQFAVFTEDNRWEGSLTNLYPGQGYLFRRLGAGNVTMHYYPQTQGNAPKRANSQELIANSQFSNPKAASNMTMIAKLDNGQWTMDNGQLKVFVGDELVAVAEPIEVEGEMLYFLTIQSDQVGNLRFEMNGQELMVKGESVRYSADSHHGSLKAPVVLTTQDSLLTTFKILEDNHVVVIRNNEKYDVTGKKL
jgi:hypothetical protein